MDWSRPKPRNTCDRRRSGCCSLRCWRASRACTRGEPRWRGNCAQDSTRAPIVFPVRVAVGAHVVQTTTREVSEEGVFVCSLRPPTPGTRIDLKLYVPGGPSAEEAVAVVREWRSAEGGYWAEFVDLPQPARDRITGLLER